MSGTWVKCPRTSKTPHLLSFRLLDFGSFGELGATENSLNAFEEVDLEMGFPNVSLCHYCFTWDWHQYSGPNDSPTTLTMPRGPNNRPGLLLGQLL